MRPSLNIELLYFYVYIVIYLKVIRVLKHNTSEKWPYMTAIFHKHVEPELGGRNNVPQLNSCITALLVVLTKFCCE